MNILRAFAALLLGGATLVCSAPPTAAPSPSAVLSTDPPAPCPVTLAFQRPPDQVIDWARAGASPAVSHDEAVEAAKHSNWAGANGIWIPLPPDGRVTWGTSTSESKFPVWLTATGIVTATARRIDGPTPPDVKGRFNGGDPTGQAPGFNSSAITFPTNGCWEVTYRAGADATLKFVVNVVRS